MNLTINNQLVTLAELRQAWHEPVTVDLGDDARRRIAESQELIDEGLLDASDFPDFATESGYRPEQTEFIDGVSFDGSKPNAYLKKFSIGLTDEVL